MRKRTPIAVLLIAVLLAVPKPAPQAAASQFPAVTVSVVSAPLPAVLQVVARAAAVGITVDPSVPEEARATVHFQNTPLPAAWSVLEQAYGLVIREASPRTYIASRIPSGQRGVTLQPAGWDGTVVRVYRLQHAVAEYVAEALAQLFGSSAPQQVAQPSGQQAQAPQGQPAAQLQTPQQPAPDARSQVTVAIAAVPETNQVLVRAPAHMAFIIATAIRQLDVAPSVATPTPTQSRRKPSGPTTESYTLRYARPSAAAKVISEQVANIKVSADDTLNTIVVTGTEADHARVRAILETLDRPVSQLLVEAEVFSVQDSVEKALGIDWTINAAYTISLAPGSLDPFQIVARLQAAARQGKAQVVSRPRVLTVSGEQATITVGDQVPVLGRDQQGNTIVVQTVNAGMRLQVTPRILPDGNVELQLAAEANTLSGFVDNFPIISQRSVQTRLSIRDGTPVIIGGLIGENRSTTTARLPFLADLPILGVLFRSTTTRAERVELVIVVTPRVVSSGPIQSPPR